jgi:pyruvate formate lyase activating enzyme
MLKEASYYKLSDEKNIRCFLCPHQCLIPEGKTGFCGVRRHQGGKLYALNYSRVASLALDPIEKKPLYHFHPGSFILSAGTIGCNLSCLFCQNWSISKEVAAPTQPVTSRELVRQAQKQNSLGIAYTYNEPFIWFEFVLETARMAREAGLKNVLVTNGYVSPEPLKEILPLIDAANIDIKSIRDEFYKSHCSGRVDEVLETVKTMCRSCHVELTNLLIPTLNGDKVPLHFSRYFPCYKMTIPSTPLDTLYRAEAIAKKKLKYVYLGNI